MTPNAIAASSNQNTQGKELSVPKQILNDRTNSHHLQPDRQSVTKEVVPRTAMFHFTKTDFFNAWFSSCFQLFDFLSSS
jgi:hypothetical protein